METKKCAVCFKVFFRRKYEWINLWEYRKYCSTKCRNLGLRGKNHPLWKGDEVGKDQLHTWLHSRIPKPELCDSCQKKQPYDLANITGIYNRDFGNWKWLCRKCHMESDGRKNNLLKGISEKVGRDKLGRFYLYPQISTS